MNTLERKAKISSLLDDLYTTRTREIDIIEQLKELTHITTEENNYWRPGINEEYWSMNPNGRVLKDFYQGFGSEIDRFHIGNMFKTKEEALSQVERLKILTKLKHFSREFEYASSNFRLNYSIKDNEFVYQNYPYQKSQGALYFESEERLKQAVKLIGEETIKKYLFGIEYICEEKLHNEELTNFRIEDILLFPETDEEYWFIYSFGEIDNEKWLDFQVDKDRLYIGNVFKSEEEAKFQVEKLKVLAELRRYSREFKYGSANFCLHSYGTHDEFVYNNYSYQKCQGALYFESEEVLKDAIRKVGEERIKRYLFGIE